MNDHVADPFRSILNAVVPVTDFRVDRVAIRETEYYQLPPATQRLIAAYADQVQVVAGIVTFTLAVGRWDEVLQTLEGVWRR
jgi:hypothetical protein